VFGRPSQGAARPAFFAAFDQNGRSQMGVTAPLVAKPSVDADQIQTRVVAAVAVIMFA
jgi:hypothetical protein